MIDNLSGPTARINQSLDQTIGRLERAEQGFSDMTKSGMAMGLLGKELASAALSPVEATFETKKALGELSSVGIKDLKALEQAGKQFSDTWAGTTKADFIASAYDIKSGISTLSDTAVAEYTKIAGITAKGTKSSVNEMTDLFATGYGIYKGFYKDMSDLEFGEMFSAGIARTVEQYKTDGSKVAQSIQTLGAAATSAQVPLEEQLSVLGMLGTVMSGGEAGTKYKAFLKSAAKAGDELGLSFLDANNQLRSMPEIIAELKGKYGDTVDAIEKMEMQKAFGTEEAVALINELYNKTDQLQTNIVGMYDSMGQGINIAKLMADAINQTEGEQYELLKQKIHNVKEEIGNQLLPTFMNMLNKGFEILTWLSKWIDKNQTAVKWIMHIVLVLGIALMAFGAFNLVVGGVGLIVTKTIGNFRTFGTLLRGIPSLFETMQIRAMYAGDAIKNGFTSIKTFASSAVTGIKSVATSIIQMGKAAIINGANAIKQMVLGMVNMARQAVVTAVQAMPGLIASVWSFTAALLANPITWVIIGIVALIAALVLLWQNWDSVVSFLTGVWNAAVEGVIGAFNWIKEKVASMPNGFVALIAAIFPFIGLPMLIFKNWGKIKAFFSDIWNGIKTGFTNFFTNFLPNVLNSGKKIMETLATGIKKTISKPFEAVKGALGKIRKLLPFSDAKEGPLSTLTLSGKRVFETINTGMMKTKHLPAETTKEAFKGIDLSYETSTEGNDYSMEPRKVEKVSLKEIYKERETQSKESTNEKSEGTTQYININVDIDKIKELPLLVKLLKEIEDWNNSNNPKPSHA